MKALENPRVLLQLGLAAFVLANLSMHFVHPTASFSADAKDGLTGFLYGVAIAAMLLGIVKRGRRPA
jgi:hypothetical protein